MVEKFDTDIIEPEEKNPLDYNPLDESVNEKAYTIPNINMQGVNLNAPIEEPKFAPPPIQNTKKEEKVKPEPVNPEMRNLGKKDTDMAAEHMADMILHGYQWLHDWGNKALQISEKKLNKLQESGEINLNAMIDYDYGKQMKASDFFKEYNEQVKDVLQVSPEFVQEVRPILIRVLSKRGIGMTDEQMLIFLFGKDLASKSMIFVSMKNQQNLLISTIAQSTISNRAQAAPPPPPPPPSPVKETPPEKSRVKDEVIEPEELEPIKVPNRRGRPKKYV